MSASKSKIDFGVLPCKRFILADFDMIFVFERVRDKLYTFNNQPLN